jgi:hypothetical protein
MTPLPISRAAESFLMVATAAIDNHRKSMKTLINIDLANDPAASMFIKDEVVEVVFAENVGEIQSAVGMNIYRHGDALVTGSTGDQWSVSRDRFDARYLPVHETKLGINGSYRAKPATVFAKQISTAFSIARSQGGDVLVGEANDWLLQYAPGDFGIVANARFLWVYRRA